MTKTLDMQAHTMHGADPSNCKFDQTGQVQFSSVSVFSLQQPCRTGYRLLQAEIVTKFRSSHQPLVQNTRESLEGAWESERSSNACKLFSINWSAPERSQRCGERTKYVQTTNSFDFEPKHILTYKPASFARNIQDSRKARGMRLMKEELRNVKLKRDLSKT